MCDEESGGTGASYGDQSKWILSSTSLESLTECSARRRLSKSRWSTNSTGVNLMLYLDDTGRTYKVRKVYRYETKRWEERERATRRVRKMWMKWELNNQTSLGHETWIWNEGIKTCFGYAGFRSRSLMRLGERDGLRWRDSESGVNRMDRKAYYGVMQASNRLPRNRPGTVHEPISEHLSLHIY